MVVRRAQERGRQVHVQTEQQLASERRMVQPQPPLGRLTCLDMESMSRT